MKYFFLILIHLIYIIPEVINHQVLRLDRIEVCGQPENSSFSVDYLQIQHKQRGSTISCKFQLRKDYNKIKIEINLVKCSNKELLDSCEKYPKIILWDACKFLADKNTVVSSATYGFSPPFMCPFKKGVYVARNATYDLSKTVFIPLGKDYWKVTSKFVDYKTNDFIFDFCLEGQAVNN